MSERRIEALAREIAARRAGVPAYLVDDETWAAAVDEARATLPPEPAPMTGLRLAIRRAAGGPLSTDSRAEREAFYTALSAPPTEETP